MYKRESHGGDKLKLSYPLKFDWLQTQYGVTGGPLTLPTTTYANAPADFFASYRGIVALTRPVAGGRPCQSVLSAIDRYFLNFPLSNYRVTKPRETVAKYLTLPQDFGDRRGPLS